MYLLFSLATWIKIAVAVICISFIMYLTFRKENNQRNVEEDEDVYGDFTSDFSDDFE